MTFQIFFRLLSAYYMSTNVISFDTGGAYYTAKYSVLDRQVKRFE